MSVEAGSAPSRHAASSRNRNLSRPFCRTFLTTSAIIVGHSSPTVEKIAIQPAGAAPVVGKLSVPVSRRFSMLARAAIPSALFQTGGPMVRA
jgi:hypothetical protein